MSVKEVMDSWTLQTGFPVITVNRNYHNGTAILTQVTKTGPTLKIGPRTKIIYVSQEKQGTLALHLSNMAQNIPLN
jgi:aminopeptidase N